MIRADFKLALLIVMILSQQNVFHNVHVDVYGKLPTFINILPNCVAFCVYDSCCAFDESTCTTSSSHSQIKLDMKCALLLAIVYK